MKRHLVPYTRVVLALALLASLCSFSTSPAAADRGSAPVPGGAAVSAGEGASSVDGAPVEVMASGARYDSRAVDLASPPPFEPSPLAAQAQFFGHNRITNWNAESGTVGADAPNWTSLGGPVPKTAAYNASDAPLLNDPGPVDRMDKLFVSASPLTSCGVAGAVTLAAQEIDLSPVSGVIASGRVTFTLAGYFGGLTDRPGAARLRVDFFDAGGGAINPVPAAVIGGYSAGDRLDRTGMIYAETRGPVPAAARKARLVLRFSADGGTSCPYTAFADNLSFVLNGPRTYLPALFGPSVAPVRTAPNAPGGISHTLKELSGINLWWVDISTNEEGFKIERKVTGVDADFKPLATVGADVTYYFDQSLPIHFSRQYTYRISAYNSAGASLPTEYSFTAPAEPTSKPAPPADCWVSNLTSTSTTFGWTDSSNNEEYFSLYIKLGADPNWYQLANIMPDATYVIIIDLSPGENTTLAITARNSQGESNYCGVTFKPPASGTRFKLINGASYPINSLIIDGVEQLPVYPLNVPVGAYYEIPLDLGAHEIEYTLGWWQDKTHRFSMYTFWRTVNIAAGVSSYTALDPTITDLMTQFGDVGYWEGYYWTQNITCYTAAFKFYKNGTYENFDHNVKIGGGTYTQVSRDPNFFTVYFNVKDPSEPSPMPATMDEINGYYFMQNGPAGWKQIEYVYKPQGYVYNSFCP